MEWEPIDDEPSPEAKELMADFSESNEDLPQQ